MLLVLFCKTKFWWFNVPFTMVSAHFNTSIAKDTSASFLLQRVCNWWQVLLPILYHHYPYINSVLLHLGGVKQQRIMCLAQGCNTPALAGFEPQPFDNEASSVLLGHHATQWLLVSLKLLNPFLMGFPCITGANNALCIYEENKKRLNYMHDVRLLCLIGSHLYLF